VVPLKQIILVRHGQAENNLHGFIGGWSDVKLTELGIKQAQAVASRLEEELKGTYKIYSSDLNRARQTAEIIGSKLKITPIYTVELREHNAGVANGMDLGEAQKYIENVVTPTLNWRPYPESESWGEFYHRVSSFMEKLCEEEERLLIVSHGGAIQNIIRWWLGTPLTDFFITGFGTSNTSITVLDSTPYRERRIERLNDTSHYSRIGLTNPIE
jgi:broad specificity phosphatase PhoE